MILFIFTLGGVPFPKMKREKSYKYFVRVEEFVMFRNVGVLMNVSIL